jgi:hypothetical protein
LNIIGYEDGVSYGFDGENGVFWDDLAELLTEVAGAEGIVFEDFGTGCDGFDAFGVVCCEGFPAVGVWLGREYIG